MRTKAILGSVAVLMTAVFLAGVQYTNADEFDSLLGVTASDIKSLSVNKSKLEGEVPVAIMHKGYVAGNDPSAGAPSVPIEWVSISGGKFMMGTDIGGSRGEWFKLGTDSGGKGFEDAKPIHEVTIETFDMSKTAVTVEQYAECVIKGQCTEPGAAFVTTEQYAECVIRGGGECRETLANKGCNWGSRGRRQHPVNCVTWDQANQYAKFKGGRLPSESEWEYAARSLGKNQKYPWGDKKADCNRAVMFGNGGLGCGYDSTMPVCSKTDGNTAQGLCDMAGNVSQWVQDKYQESYTAAPTNGSAFEGAGDFRVVRGGSFNAFRYDIDLVMLLRADYRNYLVPGYRYGGIGFRLARSSR